MMTHKKDFEMSMIEKDRIELIERQIAESVTIRVRAELFKLYAAVGLAVATVIALLGLNVVLTIEDKLVRTIEMNIVEKREKIDQQIVEAEFLADNVKKINKNTESVLQDTKAALIEFDVFKEQLSELNTISDKLKDTIEQVTSLRTTAQNVSDIYAREVKPIISGVETMSNQFKALTEQIGQINAFIKEAPTANATTIEDAVKRATALESVIDSTNAAEQRIDAARQKTSVFLQFAVGTRTQALELTKLLAKNEFIVPEPDRTEAALNKYEVRYFHIDDQSAAERLAEEANKSLSALGYPEDPKTIIKAKSFVHTTEKKPRLGVIELWLQIPERLGEKTVH
jgi:hypothetical protein